MTTSHNSNLNEAYDYTTPENNNTPQLLAPLARQDAVR